MRAWWGPAKAREAAAEGRPLPAPRDGGRVSRSARARLHHTWERRGGRFIAVAIGVVGARVVDDTWTNLFVVLVVVMAIAFTVSDMLKLWYERS